MKFKISKKQTQRVGYEKLLTNRFFIFDAIFFILLSIRLFLF